MQVHEYMVERLHGVGVCLRPRAAALEKFAADQAGVNVHVGQGDGADFFEVEIKVGAVDGVEVGAFLPGAGAGVVDAAAGCECGGGVGGKG